MKIKLAYGAGHLELDVPEDRTTVIQPAFHPGLPEERGAVLAALRNPIGCQPLADWIGREARVCIVFSDITRATPNERLIPWLLDEIRSVDPVRVTLLNATGTHRPNTPEELEHMLTPAVVRNYRVLNHDCQDSSSLVTMGTTRTGIPARLNRHWVEADVRIVTGFIEPHFFAGFSGGPKGIVPGVAGLDTIMSNHGAHHIGDSRASFGITEGNPLWEELRDIARRPGPAFLLNVTLNERRQITGVFAGDLVAAHRAGTKFARESAMQRVDRLFDVVVTTNSGYPLDLNLYQGVKGMSAGVRILKPGGTLILACECREGVPAGSPFDRILRSASSPEAILSALAASGRPQPEQWQGQIQALIQCRARVLLHSALEESAVLAAHLIPCPDISGTVRRLLADLGPAARLAVLPQGPLSIPYVA